MKRIEMFGYKVSADGMTADTATAMAWATGAGRGHYLACANPHSLVVASRDDAFRDALQAADLLVPDGAGISLAARVFNQPLPERVAGYDFFHRFSRLAEARGGLSYFFLGSSEEVLGRIATRLQRDFPAIRICGLHSPPFKAEFSPADDEAMVRLINQAKPDVLWVGMTAPKQEKWIYRNRHRLEVPFMAAVGAVFGFYAGTTVRSSPFWCRLGLEWLPRFLREPRRLWRRNLHSTPVFLCWMAREKFRRLAAPPVPEFQPRLSRHDNLKITES